MLKVLSELKSIGIYPDKKYPTTTTKNKTQRWGSPF
jgi:hypothetical protein